MAANAGLSGYDFVYLDDAGDSLGLALDLEPRFLEQGLVPVTPLGLPAMNAAQRAAMVVFHLRAHSDEFSTRARVRLAEFGTGRLVFEAECDYGAGLLSRREQTLRATSCALAPAFANATGR